MAEPNQIHNELVPQLLRQIFIAADEDYKKVLVITESLIFGVILSLAQPGHSEAFVDALAKGVKQRLEAEKSKLS